jgi:hypothetical protein
MLPHKESPDYIPILDLESLIVPNFCTFSNGVLNKLSELLLITISGNLFQFFQFYIHQILSYILFVICNS